MGTLFSLRRDGLGSFWRLPDAPGTVSVKELPDAAPRDMEHALPRGAAWAGVDIEAAFIPHGNEACWIHLPPYHILLGGTGEFAALFTPWRCARSHSWDMGLRRGEPNALRVRIGSGRAIVTLNGVAGLTFESRYASTIGRVGLQWPSETVIEQLELKAVPAAEIAMPKAVDDFEYQVTVDVPDDMYNAPVTRPVLDRLMRMHAEWGIKRVSWIYHGGLEDGNWDGPDAGGQKSGDYTERTFASLGPNLLKPAVEAAHAAGLKLHAVIKPFEKLSGIDSYPEGSAEAGEYGRAKVIGGYICKGWRFGFEHPELSLQRRAVPDTTGRRIARIVLQSAVAVDPPAGISIWTSENNGTYDRYDEDHSIRTAPGRIEIDGLRIDAPYVAVQVGHESSPDKPDTGDESIAGGMPGANTFLNTLDRLLTLYDEAGEPIPFTYGLKPRTFAYYRRDEQGAQVRCFGGGVLETDGLCFDSYVAWGSPPSSLYTGETPDHKWFALDNEYGVVGAAPGKNLSVPGVMCPSEPEARAHWLSLVDRALSFGVDGIDIRVNNHSNTLEWPEYGFNRRVVDTYRERHGSDPRAEPFDMEKMRVIRGEFYTEFLREVKAVVRGAGKRFQIHIEDFMAGEPDVSTPMEFHWDWRTWIDSVQPDEVTFKVQHFDSYREHIGREVVCACRAAGVPVYFTPYVAQFIKRDLASLVADIRQCGFNGLNIYENAAVVVPNEDGSFRERTPNLVEFLAGKNAPKWWLEPTGGADRT